MAIAKEQLRQIIAENDINSVGDISGIEEKVISLYSRGMTTRDIHDQLQDLYGIVLSADMVSKITDKILPEVKEWQSANCISRHPLFFFRRYL